MLVQGSVSCSQQWWQVARLHGTVLWHGGAMSINHVLLLQIFSEQKHNKIKPQYLLYMNNKNTRNASQMAKIAGPANAILIHCREYSELRCGCEMRLHSTAQLYHCLKCRSLGLDILSFLLKMLHILFRHPNYNLKTSAWWHFPISFPV